jgi:pyruvate-formate lyase-activating enzyme
VDPDVRQDHDQYDSSQIDRRGREMKLRYPKNRLASHLMNNCLLTYNCPAARNFAFERWEMPLPTAPKCNSRCFGCISQQPKKGFAISQQRLDFVPTAEEIAGIAIPHLEKAERPVASFGQGCEGEPLTNPELLEEAIRAIRAATSRGTINLNTNGSLPGAVEKLFGAGLDSIRVSINSLKPDWYTRYYAPQGYSFEDVLETLRVAARKKKFCSLNYLVFPGITDAASEVEAFLNVLRNIPVDMIQWRNLNIDPDEYLDYLEADPDEERIGIRQLLQKVRQEFPQVRFGYFNPCLTEDLVRNP